MPDDRDQLFEKALARQLRAASAGESWCLDPETLAAYQERALSPEELSTAKSHIVSCLRCQEILAQLETTEEIADSASHPNVEREIVPALATAKPVASAIREEVLVAAGSARSTGPQKVTSIAMRSTWPSSRLRLAVPAGAIAAGLLLLIGLREFRPAALKPAAEPAQVAENRAPVPAPQESSEALRIGEKDKLQLKKQEERQALEMSEPAAAPMSRSDALRDEKKDFSTDLSRGEAPQLSGKVLHSPAMIPRQRAAGPNVIAGQAQAADAIQQSAPAIIGGASQQVELAPKAVPPQASVLDDNAARTRAKAGIGGGEGTRTGPAPAPAPPPPSTDADNPQESAGNARPEITTKAPASVVAAYSRTVNKIALDIRVPAPGGKKIWSVGPNGQIFYSIDSGHSWLLQTSGVSSNLTGGSAPSDKVCWIVGAAGTLLRTTDGGDHWQLITTPITGDLGGVHASDAQHAAIWDATNHLRYESTDGGTTWKPSANE